MNTHGNIKKQANKLLLESIIKYGWESHKVEVLEEIDMNDLQAQDKEMFWIRTMMANSNKWPERNGLNLTDGGLGIKGYKFTDEGKAKIGKANAIILKGKKLPQSVKDKIGEKSRKPLLIYNLMGEFIKEVKSAEEAYFFMYNKQGSTGHIAEVAKGKRKSFNGFIFKYKDLKK
jgi:hypothetical protein